MTIKIISIVLVFTVVGCSNKNLKITDPTGSPIEGALVLSEQHGYIFSPWIVSINNSDNEGYVYNADRTFTAIFKKGFHPLVQRNDLTGVLYPRSNKGKDGSIHPLLNDPYYPNFFNSSPIESVVILYPIRPSNVSKYTVTAKNYILNSKEIIKLENKECINISVEYKHAKNYFLIESKTNNIISSPRFFFVDSDGNSFTNRLEGEMKISFYCVNPDSSVFKIGWAVNHMKSLAGEWGHTLIKMVSKVSGVNKKIEPKVIPIHPIFLDVPFIYDKKPKLITNLNDRSVINSINKNIPKRTEYELEYSKKWIDLYEKIKANE